MTLLISMDKSYAVLDALHSVAGGRLEFRRRLTFQHSILSEALAFVQLMAHGTPLGLDTSNMERESVLNKNLT